MGETKYEGESGLGCRSKVILWKSNTRRERLIGLTAIVWLRRKRIIGDKNPDEFRRMYLPHKGICRHTHQFPRPCASQNVPSFFSPLLPSPAQPLFLPSYRPSQPVTSRTRRTVSFMTTSRATNGTYRGQKRRKRWRSSQTHQLSPARPLFLPFYCPANM